MTEAERQEKMEKNDGKRLAPLLEALQKIHWLKNLVTIPPGIQV